MTIKARINSDHEFLISGTLHEGKNVVSLKKNGDLEVNKIYTKLDAIDINDDVDDENELDGDYEIDEEKSMEIFLTWFFGIDSQEINPNEVSFIGNMNVLANDIKEKQELGSV